ncbi:MAG: hypothetical protein WCZ89_08930, partial [Phycisphaerae bacterium]
LISLILVFFASAIPAQARKSKKSADASPGGVEWTISYLKSRNLPALQKVRAWENQYGPGLIITTGHYKIYTTLLDPLMLSQIPGFIESAYNGYQRQLPEPFETSAKMPVYLFATRGQWEDFTKEFAGNQSEIYLKIKTGAYYLKDAWVGYNIGRDLTFSVLGHEGWHQFNHRLFKYRLPSWLDEGIAMAFEASRFEKGIFRFDPSMNLHRLGGLKMTLMKNKMIPLRQLIAMNPGEAIMGIDSIAGEPIDGSDDVIAFYSQSYALVRFLKEDNHGSRLKNFQQMLLGGLRGTWPIDEQAQKIATDRNIPLTVGWNRVVGTKLFEHYIGEDIEQIEQQYLEFCKRLVYNVHFKQDVSR